MRKIRNTERPLQFFPLCQHVLHHIGIRAIDIGKVDILIMRNAVHREMFGQFRRQQQRLLIDAAHIGYAGTLQDDLQMKPGKSRLTAGFAKPVNGGAGRFCTRQGLPQSFSGHKYKTAVCRQS